MVNWGACNFPEIGHHKCLPGQDSLVFSERRRLATAVPQGLRTSLRDTWLPFVALSLVLQYLPVPLVERFVIWHWTLRNPVSTLMNAGQKERHSHGARGTAEREKERKQMLTQNWAYREMQPEWSVRIWWGNGTSARHWHCTETVQNGRCQCQTLYAPPNVKSAVSWTAFEHPVGFCYLVTSQSNPLDIITISYNEKLVWPRNVARVAF